MLETIKRWLGLVELSDYERDVLSREYARLERRRASKERELQDVPVAKSKKKQNPKAKELISEIRRIEDRQKEIERKLGGAPSSSGQRSKRSGS